jgi:hypothetical protein
LAIEFDTWYNSDDGDPFNNHISIQTRGTDALHHAHKYSIAHSADIGNFADGKAHKVRVTYQPNIDLSSYITRSRIRQPNNRHQTPIIAYKHATKFFNKDSAHYRMGQLSVYLDENPQAILEVPINLAAAIGLDTSGAYGSEDQMTKAWIGFTASTGKAFQRHEILTWHYTATPTTHPHPKRPGHCNYNTLPYDDDPVCHAPKVCSSRDRMESEHVGPNDPRNPRGAGHPDHYMMKYAYNCDKYFQPRGTEPLVDMKTQTGSSHPLPSSGSVTMSSLGQIRL